MYMYIYICIHIRIYMYTCYSPKRIETFWSRDVTSIRRLARFEIQIHKDF